MYIYPRVVKIFGEKGNILGLILHYFKDYYKAIVIDAVVLDNRHMFDWNITESPKINPHINGQLTFVTGA